MIRILPAPAAGRTIGPRRPRRIPLCAGLLLPALLLAGCGGGGGPATGRAGAADSASMSAARAGAGLTGAVSEEDFKALHELRKGATPPLHGAMTEVDGVRAYLSLPADATPPLPALVVIHEWWGLNDNIKFWSDRLAALGYAALAVDLYDGRVAEDPDSALAYMKAVDPARALPTLLAAERFLASDPRIRAVHRGVIGWCFGGGYSLQTALHDSTLDAAVLYYGRPVDDVSELRKIHAPLLGIFGNLDPSIPPDAVNAFDEALTRAGVPHQILRYDATHAFANPSSARYDGKAAADAWAHVRGFLEESLQDETGSH